MRRPLFYVSVNASNLQDELAVLFDRNVVVGYNPGELHHRFSDLNQKASPCPFTGEAVARVNGTSRHMILCTQAPRRQVGPGGFFVYAEARFKRNPGCTVRGNCRR